MNYQGNFKIMVLLKKHYWPCLQNYSEQLLKNIQSAFTETFSSLWPLVSVNRFTKNLSSFLTGYNWVNQICNHDHARNVTFNDKFDLIRHDKPDSKKQGLYFVSGNVASPGFQETELNLLHGLWNPCL